MLPKIFNRNICSVSITSKHALRGILLAPEFVGKLSILRKSALSGLESTFLVGGTAVSASTLKPKAILGLVREGTDGHCKYDKRSIRDILLGVHNHPVISIKDPYPNFSSADLKQLGFAAVSGLVLTVKLGLSSDIFLILAQASSLKKFMNGKMIRDGEKLYFGLFPDFMEQFQKYRTSDDFYKALVNAYAGSGKRFGFDSTIVRYQINENGEVDVRLDEKAVAKMSRRLPEYITEYHKPVFVPFNS